MNRREKLARQSGRGKYAKPPAKPSAVTVSTTPQVEAMLLPRDGSFNTKRVTVAGATRTSRASTQDAPWDEAELLHKPSDWDQWYEEAFELCPQAEIAVSQICNLISGFEFLPSGSDEESARLLNELFAKKETQLSQKIIDWSWNYYTYGRGLLEPVWDSDDKTELRKLKVPDPTTFDVLRDNGADIKDLGDVNDKVTEALAKEAATKAQTNNQPNATGAIIGYIQTVELGAGQTIKRFYPPDQFLFMARSTPKYPNGVSVLRNQFRRILYIAGIEEMLARAARLYANPPWHFRIGSEKYPVQPNAQGQAMMDFVKAQVDQVVSVSDDIENITALYLPNWVEFVIPRFDLPIAGDLIGHLAAERQALIMAIGVPPALLSAEGWRACYSEDTKTLTENGWKYYWEVKDGERIATYNPETGKLEYHIPIAKFVYDHDGAMVQFKSQGVDILVTPEHEMWTGTQLHLSGKQVWHLVKASDLLKKAQVLFINAAEHDGREETVFTLPACEVRVGDHRGIGVRIQESADIPMDDWLEFLGYFLSEGTTNPARYERCSYLTEISQNDGAKSERISSCLQKMSANMPYLKLVDKFYPSRSPTHRFHLYGKQLTKWLVENVGTGCENKRIPRTLLVLSQRQSKILFEALMLGDGSWQREKTSGCYYSKSIGLAEDVQELALKLGYSTKIIWGSRVWRVLLSKHVRKHVSQRGMASVQYAGKVYCFEVPNHLFITSRNGCPTIQGNTSEQAMRFLEDRITPVRDLIEKHVTDAIILPYLTAVHGGNPPASHLLISTQDQAPKLVPEQGATNETGEAPKVGTTWEIPKWYWHDITSEDMNTMRRSLSTAYDSGWVARSEARKIHGGLNENPPEDDFKELPVSQGGKPTRDYVAEEQQTQQTEEKTRRERQVEEKYGKPIQAVLYGLMVEQNKSKRATARELGISLQTLYNWNEKYKDGE